MSFLGKEGFIWWVGVVEDRFDPLYLGRCKVRILGWHTKDKTILPTKNLPWCSPIQPITSAAQTGVGISPTGVVEGSWVFGFYRDAKSSFTHGIRSIFSSSSVFKLSKFFSHT